MRNLILAFTLSLLGSVNLLSQINVTEREILKLQPTQSVLNSDWCNHLEYYRDSTGITSTRSDILDTYALERAMYFATVLDLRIRPDYSNARSHHLCQEQIWQQHKDYENRLSRPSKRSTSKVHETSTTERANFSANSQRVINPTSS